MGFDCCPVIRCQVCKQGWQIQIWGDSWKEGEWAMLLSDFLPFCTHILPSACPCWVCCPCPLWHVHLPCLERQLKSSSVWCGHPRPALIGVSLLDTHQSWQPPMLRHPPLHQSVSIGRVHPGAIHTDTASTTFLLTVHHAEGGSVMAAPPHFAISASLHMVNHSPCCHIAGEPMLWNILPYTVHIVSLWKCEFLFILNVYMQFTTALQMCVVQRDILSVAWQMCICKC